MEQALSVTQISTYFKQIFEAEEMLFNVKVIGEISGMTNARGVAYFVLKDDNAQMNCVCFNTTNFNFKNGDKVYVTGTPRYYVKGGKLNFNVTKVEEIGLGELFQQFIKLKDKLEKLGYFDQERKKSIPDIIKRIGVVTSPTGAVIQDIINVRNRRNPNIDIVLFPVKVQGENAEKEIAHGIEVLDNYKVDVIIVARGGGSLEDLMPFNTEVVANAIYYAKTPIVSAVGHETDFTICDFCSDERAPTPSAASEILCKSLKDNRNMITMLAKRLYSCSNQYVINNNSKIELYKSNILKSIDLFNENKIVILNKKAISFSQTIKNFVDDKINSQNIIQAKLLKLNPNEILKLGYASIKCKDKNIQSVNHVQKNDDLDVIMYDGIIKTKVIDVCGGKK